MGLGISLAINLSTNTSLFKKGLASATDGITEFYKSFNDNVKASENNWGFGIEAMNSFKKSIKESTPLIDNMADSFTPGGDYLLAKSLIGANNSLKELNEGLIKFAAIDIKNEKYEKLRDSLAKMDPEKMAAMGDSVKLMMTNLDRFTPKQQKELINTLHEMSGKKTVEGVESVAKSLKDMTEQAKLMADMKDGFANKISGMKRYISIALGLSSIQQIFTEILNVQNELARSTFQMGRFATAGYDNISKGAQRAIASNQDYRKSIRQATDDLMVANREVATATQSSMSEVGTTMAELMNMRVASGSIDDLQELSNTSMLLQKGLGLSSGAANQFVKDLSLVGGIGAKDIKNAAQELSYVQQNLGLTSEEAQLVGSTVGTLMRQFRTFGGSAKDVAIVTKEVGKMTAAFSSVGLAASDAQQILNDMMNPDNLGKSIMLWNQMGMSAAEGMAMMQGQGSNMEGMTERMVIAAKNLKEQYGGNIYALKAMAEASGMTLAQVQALSEYDATRLADMKKQASLEQAAAAARQGLNDQWLRFKNQILIVLQGALLPTLKILGQIMEWLISGIAKLNTWMDKIASKSKKHGDIIRALLSNGLIAIILIIKNLKIVGFLVKGLGGIFGSVFGGIFGGALNRVKGLFGSVTKQGKGFSGMISSIGKAFESWPAPTKILAIAGAILLMSLGIAAIVMAVVQMIKAVSEANLQFGDMAFIIATLIVIFAGVIGMMWGMTFVIKALGTSGLAAAPGIMAASVALVVLGAAVILFGIGIGLAAAGIGYLVKAITDLVVKVIGALIQGFINIGKNAKEVALGLLIIVGAIYAFAVASILLSAGVTGIIVALMAFAAVIGIFMIASKLFESLGDSFMNIGNGINLLATQIKPAIQGLIDLKTELKDGWKGAADNAITEIERINASLNDMQKLSLGSLSTNIISNVIGKVSSENESKSSAKTIDYSSQLNTANTHLESISSNTATTNVILERILVATKKTQGNVKTITANIGVG